MLMSCIASVQIKTVLGRNSALSCRWPMFSADPSHPPKQTLFELRECLLRKCAPRCFQKSPLRGCLDVSGIGEPDAARTLDFDCFFLISKRERWKKSVASTGCILSEYGVGDVVLEVFGRFLVLQDNHLCVTEPTRDAA